MYSQLFLLCLQCFGGRVKWEKMSIFKGKKFVRENILSRTKEASEFIGAGGEVHELGI